VTRKLLIFAPLLATAAIAAGCGGSDAYDTDTSSQPASSAATVEAATPEPTVEASPEAELPTESIEQGEAPAEAATTEVKMAGSTFAPANIEINVGDTVTFVNDDAIAHTATADDGTFDSGTMDPGATFDFTAEKAGTISYVCAFHPGMTGKITVT
jgi:plastocyanin